MKMLKRVAWLCFAGCCCAGLMLIGGERSQQSGSIGSGGISLCPSIFYGQINGAYAYAAFQLDADCTFPKLLFVADTRMHEIAPCGTCPDPIFLPAGHPAPAELAEPTPVPQPDPMFSGILR